MSMAAECRVRDAAGPEDLSVRAVIHRADPDAARSEPGKLM